MQDEITEQTCSFAARVGEVTVSEIRRALEKLIPIITESKNKISDEYTTDGSTLEHGKQTLKQLQKQNDGLSSIELKDPELRRPHRAMKKDNVDFAVVKDGKGKYTLFFKSKDADTLTHAFDRYTKQIVKR